QEEVFRLEDGVALEFADPVAVGALEVEQPVAGALQRADGRRGGRAGGNPTRGEGAGSVHANILSAFWGQSGRPARQDGRTGPVRAEGPQDETAEETRRRRLPGFCSLRWKGLITPGILAWTQVLRPSPTSSPARGAVVITVPCPACQKSLAVKEELAG